MAVVSDDNFARCLIQIGGATPEQIQAAQEAQLAASKSGRPAPLAEILIQRGIITAAMRENVEKKAAGVPGGIQKLGKYKLIRKLGEGGMGVVYLADDTDMQRQVALKVLPKKFVSDLQALTRFKREAHAAGKLNHVNIVGAFDDGEDAGHHFYVMEYCDGEPLNVVLKREKTMALDKALDIVIQVAHGLKHAHDQGFIHRDIKPANIFIAGGGVAKILDLGLTKELNDSDNSFNTQTGIAIGTPHYISPEQAKGKNDLNGQADIYSLGATYYHLITGQTPFMGSTSAVIMSKHLNEQLPNPQDIREDVPDSVAHIIANMMAKSRADRYPNCDKLLEDLELVRAGKEPSSQALDALKTSIATRARVVRKPGTSAETVGESRRRRTGEPRESGAGKASNKNTLYVAAGAGALAVLAAAFFITQSQPPVAPPAPKVPVAPAPVAEAHKKDDEAEAQRLAAERQRADEARLKAELAKLDEDRRKLDEEKRKVEEERKRAEAAQAAQRTPAPPAEVAVKTAPPPVKPVEDKAPAVAATPLPPKVDEPKPAPPTSAIAANAATSKVDDALAECLALIAKGQVPAAIASGKKAPSADAQAVVRVLERGQALRAQALENLIKKPPTDAIQIPKLGLSGVISKIDAKQAYVKAEGAEMPVALAQLPNALFVRALALNENKPEGAADKATYLISNGDLDQAKTLIPPLDKQTYADLHLCLDLMARVEKQKQFDAALTDAEKAIGPMDGAAAQTLVQTLTQKFASVLDSQKERMDKLAARAQGKRAMVLLKQAFSGEVLKADDSLNVEVRYDEKKGQDVWKDFELGENWQLGSGGITAIGKRMEGKDLKFTPRFQPGTLRVEMLLESGFHDIFILNLGKVHAKPRWFGEGNLLMTYEPKYSRDVNDGGAWAKPQSFGGAYRYVVERTPDSARFLLDDKEHAKIALTPGAVKAEGPASFSIWSWGDVTVKEFIIKGAVDPEWLKSKTQK